MGVVQGCSAPDGVISEPGDGDDANDAVHPGAGERGNQLDDDCDAAVDDDPVDPVTWFPDGDGDGFGDANRSLAACEQPAGALPEGTDCDDADAGVHPGA